MWNYYQLTTIYLQTELFIKTSAYMTLLMQHMHRQHITHIEYTYLHPVMHKNIHTHTPM